VRRRSQRPGAARAANHRFGQGGRGRRPRGGAHDDCYENRCYENRRNEDRRDGDRRDEDREHRRAFARL
jgi:hypothetical protein